MKKALMIAVLCMAAASPAAAQSYIMGNKSQSGGGASSYIGGGAPASGGRQGGAPSVILNGEAAMPLNLNGAYAETYRQNMRIRENERRQTELTEAIRRDNATKKDPLGPLPAIPNAFPAGYNASPQEIAAEEARKYEQSGGGSAGRPGGNNAQPGKPRNVTQVYRPIYAPTSSVPSMGIYNQQ